MHTQTGDVRNLSEVPGGGTVKTLKRCVTSVEYLHKLAHLPSCDSAAEIAPVQTDFQC